jgi:type II secretory pathway pseudopilin PulG
MRKSKYMFKKKSAFTLVEVIVSLSILMLIGGAIYSTFSLNQYVFQRGQDRGEVVQNGRVVIERLSRELRQSKEIITPLPDASDNPDFPPAQEISFHDGHLTTITEEQTVQSATSNSVTLYQGASAVDDYYKGTFIKIISGPGQDEFKKIIAYDGILKKAIIKGEWENLPDASSVYKIDSNYYYIRYYVENSNLKRQVRIYYFSGNPNIFVPWNAEPPVDETRQSLVIEEDIIGQFLNSVKFWGSSLVNILIELKDANNLIKISTKIFCRNL